MGKIDRNRIVDLDPKKQIDSWTKSPKKERKKGDIHTKVRDPIYGQQEPG